MEWVLVTDCYAEIVRHFLLCIFVEGEPETSLTTLRIWAIMWWFLNFCNLLWKEPQTMTVFYTNLFICTCTLKFFLTIYGIGHADVSFNLEYVKGISWEGKLLL